MAIRFEKVSKEQYNSALDEIFGSFLASTYDDIKLPKRATAKSSGYDFFAPFDFTLAPGDSVKIPTGIRVILPAGRWLMCMPRSGLGFKFRLQLDNTLGNIDPDYWESDNEGHIFAKLTNDSRDNKTVVIKQGQAFMQGVISQYFLTDDDDASGQRNGGFGSTDAPISDFR